MKRILLLIVAATLLATSGCFYPDHRGRGEYRGREEYRGSPAHHEHAEPGVDVRIRAD